MPIATTNFDAKFGVGTRQTFTLFGAEHRIGLANSPMAVMKMMEIQQDVLAAYEEAETLPENQREIAKTRVNIQAMCRMLGTVVPSLQPHFDQLLELTFDQITELLAFCGVDVETLSGGSATPGPQATVEPTAEDPKQVIAKN